jgi:Domain of Unknown Function (DUF1080)
MKCIFLGLVLFGLSVSPAGAENVPELNTLTKAEKKAGWRLLFDGKSSAGWRGAKKQSFPAKGWLIEDGVLTVLESGGGESEHGGDIVTEAEYGEFELKFEFRLTEGANSGLKYFVQESYGSQGSSIGLEYQMLDDARHEDANKGSAGNRQLSSLYDLIAAEKRSLRPIGQWNEGRIVVKGSHVEHWLNGTKVVEYERLSQMFRALVARSKYAEFVGFGQQPKGRILLQDHGNRVSFRNLKLRGR